MDRNDKAVKLLGSEWNDYRLSDHYFVLEFGRDQIGKVPVESARQHHINIGWASRRWNRGRHRWTRVEHAAF